MSLNITLDDCEVEENIGPHSIGTRYTHESGAYVELVHDESPHHPLDDAEGIAIAFREGDCYNGTAPDYPRDPTIECPACKGSGESVDRFELFEIKGFDRVVLGAGTEEAMCALSNLLYGDSLSPRGYIEAIECSSCRGEGEIDVDIETYFRVSRGALAIYEFDTGNHGEASAVMYVTDNDWTDPVAAAKAWAEEYESWAEGDVWGIETGGPGVEEESVWGFIGEKHAKEAALSEFLIPAIAEARAEAVERAYNEARDIITVEG